MARWFRSEMMEYVSMIINEDVAHSCLSDLGKLGVLQFTDLNPELTPFQRRYVSQVKRCEDLERKLRFFASECDKFKLTIESAGEVDEFLKGDDTTTNTDPVKTDPVDTDPQNESRQSTPDLRSEQASVVFENIHGDFYNKEQSTPLLDDAESIASSKRVNKLEPDPPTVSNYSPSNLLEQLDARLEAYETQLKELNDLSEKLTREFNEKVELQEVLEKATKFILIDSPRISVELEGGNNTVSATTDEENDLTVSLLSQDGGPSFNTSGDSDLRFSSITGVVATEERKSFERIIFRATRGNCFVRFINIEKPIRDPYTTELLKKSVFIIFYQSQRIENKIKKICTAFSARRYALPDISDTAAVERLHSENLEELKDSRVILLKNRELRYNLCQMLARSTERWTWIVLREKAIYHTLNMFKSDVSGTVRGEGWVVADQLSTVIETINKAHTDMDIRMKSVVEQCPKPWPTPPTYFSTNKFTYAYQEFVNTYGIPRYREANPALFTAATFPFLFGVMYGDIGHGLFLFSMGLYLLYNEKENDKKNLGEMVGGLHAGRYMMTMMGFFAVYAGFIYNDCFSLGLNLFGSKYLFPGQEDNEVVEGEEAMNIAPYGSDASVYPFGLDPIWHVSSTDLLFLNSFKMKLSVIFGIAQMSVGTCLKGLNAIYYGEKLDFFFEFLPMVVFSCSLFVYMIVLIFMKWIINWDSRMLSATCLDPNGPTWGSAAYKGNWTRCTISEGDGTCTPWGYACSGNEDTAAKCQLNFGGSGDGCQPPNLITTLINIALSPGTVDEPLYKGQAEVQNILLILALLSVPTLLCVKPILLSKMHTSAHTTHNESEEEEEEHVDEDEHSFGEIFIHQAIETIEFVLGMVSNTASYLRLWALSLAHSELAEVFWEKTILFTLNINWFATYLGFGIFAGVTFGVLLSMDVLECFLHALRLHWVEFQNKFFKADGIRFAPYSFKNLIVEASAKA